MFRLALLCIFGLTYNQVSAEQGTEAIVGGHYAREDDFKYQVFMRIGSFRRCGGAIIADRYILTAAHCVTNDNGHILREHFAVIAGTNNIYHLHEATDLHVQTVYIPKLFNLQSKLHDIAILKLKHSFQLSPHHHKLEKINLPKPGAYFENVCGIVTGFGAQEIKLRINTQDKLERYDLKSDGKLKFASVKVITNQKCDDLNHRTIPPTIICGQMIQGKHPEGICEGDSGSALVYAGEIIGILSEGPTGCSEKDSAAMYTRVSSYLHIINSVIHGHPGDDVTYADIRH